MTTEVNIKPRTADPLATLLRAMATIIESPESWDQESWRCGTQMCLAGHIATEVECTLTHPEDKDSDEVTVPGWLNDQLGLDLESGVSISDVAYALLGDMAPRQMFDGANSLYDLKAMVAVRLAPKLFESLYRAHWALLELARPGSPYVTDDDREAVASRSALLWLAPYGGNEEKPAYYELSYDLDVSARRLNNLVKAGSR